MKRFSDVERTWLANYTQGWADSRHAGTRYGPVHLFADRRVDFTRSRPLCGRSVKLWNFEGETEEDFCPRCLKFARAELAAVQAAPLTAAQRAFLRRLPASGEISNHINAPAALWFPLQIKGLIRVHVSESMRPRFARLPSACP